MKHWDIFCRVIDNYGDAGVCWRLAKQLSEEYGLSVRLWIDDLNTLAFLVPDISTHQAIQAIQTGLTVCHWRTPFPETHSADVVIEAFACTLPESYVYAMAQQPPTKPIWINLEYLSMEDWVAGCHGLASPHPSLGLTKYFFFPGPTAGGLLREQDLEKHQRSWGNDSHQSVDSVTDQDLRKIVQPRRADEDSTICAAPYQGTHTVEQIRRPACTASLPRRERSSEPVRQRELSRGFEQHAASLRNGLCIQAQTRPARATQPGQFCVNPIYVSLFAYPNPALLSLLSTWAQGPHTVHCRAPISFVTKQACSFFQKEKLHAGEVIKTGALIFEVLPFVSQTQYDQLLWQSDLNFVRGEDSFVRGQLAGRPIVWQVYPQQEQAHLDKLDAFLKLYSTSLSNQAQAALTQLHYAWNTKQECMVEWLALYHHFDELKRHAQQWRDYLYSQNDLTRNMYDFVRKKIQYR